MWNLYQALSAAGGPRGCIPGWSLYCSSPSSPLPPQGWWWRPFFLKEIPQGWHYTPGKLPHYKIANIWSTTFNSQTKNPAYGRQRISWSDHVILGPMRCLEKNCMGRGPINRQIHKRTSRLTKRIGLGADSLKMIQPGKMPVILRVLNTLYKIRSLSNC